MLSMLIQSKFEIYNIAKYPCDGVIMVAGNKHWANKVRISDVQKILMFIRHGISEIIQNKYSLLDSLLSASFNLHQVNNTTLFKSQKFNPLRRNRAYDAKVVSNYIFYSGLNNALIINNTAWKYLFNVYLNLTAYGFLSNSNFF